MNCTSCKLEITSKHDSLEYFGACGRIFHFSCLISKNKSYKKSLIRTLNDIQNLLWFCDECLPNIIAAFSPCDNQQNNQSNQIQNSIDTQQTPATQEYTQQSDSLADLASYTSTSSLASTQAHNSVQMETDDNKKEPTECIQANLNSNGKRRRISTDNLNCVNSKHEYTKFSS